MGSEYETKTQGYNWWLASSSTMMAFTGQLFAASNKVSSSTEEASMTTALYSSSRSNTVGATARQLPAPIHFSRSTLIFKLHLLMLARQFHASANYILANRSKGLNIRAYCSPLVSEISCQPAIMVSNHS